MKTHVLPTKWGIIRKDRPMYSQLKGQFNHTVDAKGRLIIPAKLRDGLGGSFVLTTGLDGCLYGYSQEEWKRKGEELMALSSSNPKIRMLQRSFNYSGTDVDIDSQGRIVVPANLRQEAGITKDVVVCGNGNKIEIWSAERYSEVFSQPVSMTDIIAELQDMGIEINF